MDGSRACGISACSTDSLQAQHLAERQDARTSLRRKPSASATVFVYIQAHKVFGDFADIPNER